MSAGDVIAILTVAGGLIALFLAREQTDTEHESAVHAAFLTISDYFMQYPELRPLFYEDEYQASSEPVAQRLGDAELRYRANTVAELVLDTYELALTERRTRKAYGTFIGQSFAASSFLRDWAIEHRQFYLEELAELAKKASEDEADS